MFNLKKGEMLNLEYLRQFSISELKERIRKFPFNQAYRLALAHSTQEEGDIHSFSFLANRSLNLTTFEDNVVTSKNTFSTESTVLEGKTGNTESANLPKINYEAAVPDWVEPNIDSHSFNEVIDLEHQTEVIATIEPATAIEERTTVEPTADQVPEMLVENTMDDTAYQESLSIEPRKKKKKSKHKHRFMLKDNTGLSSFTNWLFALNPLPQSNVKRINKRIKKQTLLDTYAANSVKKSGLISEHLASLLAQQGHINESIDMYQKLILQNPNKSVYFADQIDQLKNSINK